MNAPIVRIYVLVLLLLGSLVYFTSKWSVFDAEELEERPENRRPLIAEQQIRRGSITTSDGVLVAESLPQGGGRNPVYVRRYPEGSLFAHPVGYSFVDVGRTGFELAENDLLVGEENEFATIIDQLRGSTQEGADVTLTIDAEAQRIATQGLESAVASSGVPDIGGALGRDRARHRGGARDGVGARLRPEHGRGRGRVRAAEPDHRPPRSSTARPRASTRRGRR